MATSAARRRDEQDPASELVGPGQYPSRAKIVSAECLPGHRVRLIFADGHEGTADLAPYLTGSVFRALRDEVYFARGSFDPEVGTIWWPNGADFAPEFLRTLTEPG
jgi:hypothetical protein